MFVHNKSAKQTQKMALDIQKVGTWTTELSPHQGKAFVSHGASANTQTVWNAGSQTSSAHVYAVTCTPDVYISRDIKWTSTITAAFTITYGTNPAAAGLPVAVPGRDFGIRAFPLHSLCSNMQISIDNDSVSNNLSQTFPTYLRLNDSPDVRNDQATPVKLDLATPVSTLQGAIANPYGTILDSNSVLDPGNGAFPFVYCDNTGKPLSSTTAYTSTLGQGTGQPNTVTPVLVNGVYVPGTTIGQASYNIYVQYTVWESIMCSPFCFGKQASIPQPGLFGVRNITMTATMQTPAAAQLIVNTSLPSVCAVSNLQFAPGYAPYQNSALVVTTYSPPPSLRLPERCITPYSEMQAYPNQAASAINPGVTSQLTSATITVSSVPSLIIVRVTPSAYTNGVTGTNIPTDAPSWCLPISRATIQFDNQISCSTYDQPTLWKISAQNGQTLNFNAWRAAAQSSGVTAGTGEGMVQLVGGELVLAPGKDIPLAAQLAPGVGGNFNLSVTVTVTNPSSSYSVTPVVTLLVLSGGFFVSSNGSR